MKRLLVVALPLVWIAMAVLVWGSEGPPPTAFLLVLGAVSVGLLAALIVATRNVANAMDAIADERDRARRDHAHRLAYWFLAFPVGMAAGFAASRLERLARGGDPIVFEAAAVPALAVAIWGAVLLWVAAPSVILAWTEPAPLTDDSVGEEPVPGRA
ncbi:MAG: hypothetical protein EA421_12615 [Gemmatimonadales bacterium]|nr:MAG: hypothetical protein EA421_12615 [Gemmatimonadales bacterium]